MSERERERERFRERERERERERGGRRERDYILVYVSLPQERTRSDLLCRMHDPKTRISIN